MKFFMFLCTDAAGDSYVEERDLPTIREWMTQMESQGKLLLGEPLRPAEDATTVRVRNGQLLVTDGPFAETKEWVAGYGILECKTREEAVAVSASHPMARIGQIEVRGFWDWTKGEDQ
jgi:hypothetical protein